MSIFARLGVDPGSLLGSCWGHVCVCFGPSWSRNRLRIVLSSKKRIFTRYYVFQYLFMLFPPRWHPQTTQDPSKTGPRSSWIAFFASCFFASIFDRLGVDFGAVLGSKMEPQGGGRARQIGPWGVQDGLGVVLVRFSCRLVIQVRFFDPLGLLLGSFWGAPGVVLGLWVSSWGRFGVWDACMSCDHR